MTVLCWRTLADNVAMCLRKGEPVLVRGRLRVREYEGKDGSRGTETEIDASSIGHDLNRGVAHFSRTRRAPGETAAESAEAQAAAQSQDGEEQDPPAAGGRLPETRRGLRPLGAAGGGTSRRRRRTARTGRRERERRREGAGEGTGEKGAGGAARATACSTTVRWPSSPAR